MSEYGIWVDIKTRCYNPNCKAYPRYGGRGIVVCDRWLSSFVNFYNNMGPRPSSDHQIERKDNDGNYEPKNCVWSTRIAQCRNRGSSRLVNLGGEKITVAELSDRTGIDYSCLLHRVKKGYTGDKLIEPSGDAKKYKLGDRKYTIHELSSLANISIWTMRDRLASGMSIEDAVGMGRIKRPRSRLVLYNNIPTTVTELSRQTGINQTTLTNRIASGWSDEDVVRPVKHHTG